MYEFILNEDLERMQNDESELSLQPDGSQMDFDELKDTNFSYLLTEDDIKIAMSLGFDT